MTSDESSPKSHGDSRSHGAVTALVKLPKSPGFKSAVKVAEGLGKIIAVGTAVYTALAWLRAAPERTRATDYAAWQVVTAARGQPGSSGRVEALAALARDGVSLDGVDVSHAFLYDLHTRGASLRFANFSHDTLRHAVFDDADLTDANFQGIRTVADERDMPTIGATPPPAVTSFRGAVLTKADFSHGSFMQFTDFAVVRDPTHTGDSLFNPYRSDANADFTGAAVDYSRFDHRDFRDAHFFGATAASSSFRGISADRADFRYADLSASTFTDAVLFMDDFTGACLRGTTFGGATLEAVNFERAMMDDSTDFRGVRYDPRSLHTLAASIRQATNATAAKFDPGLAAAVADPRNAKPPESIVTDRRHPGVAYDVTAVRADGSRDHFSLDGTVWRAGTNGGFPRVPSATAPACSAEND
jgi:uncharacterized protein YjbI with pentapeptide repeats